MSADLYPPPRLFLYIYIWIEPNRIFLGACGIPKILSNLLKFPSHDIIIEATRPLRNMLIECKQRIPEPSPPYNLSLAFLRSLFLCCCSRSSPSSGIYLSLSSLYPLSSYKWKAKRYLLKREEY